MGTDDEAEPRKDSTILPPAWDTDPDIAALLDDLPDDEEREAAAFEEIRAWRPSR